MIESPSSGTNALKLWGYDVLTSTTFSESLSVLSRLTEFLKSLSAPNFDLILTDVYQ